jgi:hypothetical protein
VTIVLVAEVFGARGVAAPTAIISRPDPPNFAEHVHGCAGHRGGDGARPSRPRAWSSGLAPRTYPGANQVPERTKHCTEAQPEAADFSPAHRTAIRPAQVRFERSVRRSRRWEDNCGQKPSEPTRGKVVETDSCEIDHRIGPTAPHHAWRSCFLVSNRLDAPPRLGNWPDGDNSVEVGTEALP